MYMYLEKCLQWLPIFTDLIWKQKKSATSKCMEFSRLKQYLLVIKSQNRHIHYYLKDNIILFFIL